MKQDMGIDESALRWIKAAIEEADFVLIGAGAGLSAAAGLDYTDTESFARLFPAFVRQGFTARYQAIGYFGWSPAQFWGYWATHVLDARFGPRHDPVYRDLRSLVEGKDVFVFSSNVDGLFDRNGFDPDRIYTPQGDYAHMQCSRACQPVVWPSEPILRAVAAALDPKTQSVTDPALVPRCPNCGGEVFLNVRIDRYMVDAPYEDQARRFSDWLQSSLSGKLLVIEVGAGFNTPSVIRWPCERLVANHPSARLLRINRDRPEVPAELAGRAIGLGQTADLAIRAIRTGMEGPMSAG